MVQFKTLEDWKDVKGYEGLYQISNYGRVRNAKGKLIKTWLKKRYLYEDVILCKNGKRKHHLVHRLVAENFINNPENKEQVNHKNGIRFFNHVNNLEWCTGLENQRKKVDYYV